MNTLEAMEPVLEKTSQPARPRRIKPETRQSYLILCVTLWSIISYLLLSHFVLMAVEIKGTSMTPTLLDGQRYILFRYPYLLRTLRQGEIVVIKDPQDQDLSIKRIVALPNDVVEIRKDGVYVNNARLRGGWAGRIILCWATTGAAARTAAFTGRCRGRRFLG